MATRKTAPAGAAAFSDSNPYRILCIDGGGLRGIIPLAMLENLDRAQPGWRDQINMFAGTSTGGLIALALAKGMQPRDIMNVYITQGPKIFDRSLWQVVKTLDEAVGPKYDSDNREEICRNLLGNDRLHDYRRDGDKGHVLIAAFDIDDKVETVPARRHWKAKLFHNMPTVDNSDDGGEIAYRVAMRTSAAPTYFASYDGFVDGGVFANNISMCAIAQTQDARNAATIPLSAVRLLSLGTGWASYYIDGEEHWGLAQWAPKLVDVLTDGVLGVADYQSRQMLGDARYCRLTTQMSAPIAMDDASQIGILQRIGDAVDVTPALDLIKRW